MRYFLISICSLFVLACGKDSQNNGNFSDKKDVLTEIARDVEILYSDSADVKVRILAPTMKRYSLKSESYDEFPDGLRVEFLNEKKQPGSWLIADYAIRKDKEKKIYVESNVLLRNKKNDKLVTEALVWDEGEEEIYTSRPVKISQPSKGDTLYGHGFKADQEFTRFEIKKQFSAIKNDSEIAKDFDN